MGQVTSFCCETHDEGRRHGGMLSIGKTASGERYDLSSYSARRPGNIFVPLTDDGEAEISPSSLEDRIDAAVEAEMREWRSSLPLDEGGEELQSETEHDDWIVDTSVLQQDSDDNNQCLKKQGSTTSTETEGSTVGSQTV